MGAGRIHDDIKIAVKDGFDFVELDGMQGSTGAGSAEVIDYVGIPTLAAIVEALEGAGRASAAATISRSYSWVVSAMAWTRSRRCAWARTPCRLWHLGDRIAGGCIACMQCHVGQCVTGIATQDRDHEARYKPQVEAQNIHRFLETVRWQMAALTHAMGYDDMKLLNREDLVALTPEAAEITGVPYAPEIPRPGGRAARQGGLRWFSRARRRRWTPRS